MLSARRVFPNNTNAAAIRDDFCRTIFSVHSKRNSTPEVKKRGGIIIIMPPMKRNKLDTNFTTNPNSLSYSSAYVYVYDCVYIVFV